VPIGAVPIDAEVPLAEIRGVDLRRSPLGRLVGYGTFVIKSSVPGSEVVKLRHVPYPEQVYLELHGLLFPDDGQG
jgi:hypothetical protein